MGIGIATLLVGASNLLVLTYPGGSGGPGSRVAVDLCLHTPSTARISRIYQPFKDGRLGMIDARDVGEVAAKVLTEEGHEGKTYTLTGPAAISFYDVAGALSEVLGKKVSYISIPLEKANGAMLGMGIPEWKADL